MSRAARTELRELLGSRLSLVVGPGATLRPGAFTDLSAALATEFKVAAGATYLSTAQAAVSATQSESRVRDFAAGWIGRQERNPAVATLAQVPWKAVLSTSLDLHLENELIRAADASPFRPKVTVLHDTTATPPPLSVPAFKLLGTAAHSEFAYSETKYLLRKVAWRDSVRHFMDRTRQGTVVCLGMSDTPWAFHELLALFADRAATAPRLLVLLGDDPLQHDRLLLPLLKPSCMLKVIDDSLSGLLKLAQEAANSAQQMRLFRDSDAGQQFEAFSGYVDLVAVVNAQLAPTMQPTERNRLNDLLFSPSAPDWNPFAFDLDLRRTLGAGLLSEMTEQLSTRGAQADHDACLVTGNVASGKTTIQGTARPWPP